MFHILQRCQVAVVFVTSNVVVYQSSIAVKIFSRESGRELF
jgi:hypothetical protein